LRTEKEGRECRMFVMYRKRGESEKGVGCLLRTEKEGRG